MDSAGTTLNTDAGRKAILYRMVTPQHRCPWGLRSKDLLRREGYEVEDHLLASREEIDAFKSKHDVKTTPQTFIGGARIGGYDDLRRHFGKKVRDPKAKTYAPVVAVFASAAAMGLAASYGTLGQLFTIRAVELFAAFSMCLLGVLKLRDLDTFVNSFLGYDLLAQRVVRYGYVYPFAELGVGLAMLSGVLMWLAGPVAFFIGAVGAVSVYKAVYIEKRDLKCACVGGDINVPLGFISLTENLLMIAMAIWMAARMI